MARVSVIIPTYNRARYVVDAVSSALGQQFGDREVIVVDDGSTDDTAERLSLFGGRIRYIRQSNQGPGIARNAGIRVSSGEYIAFLDSDDIWLPDKLSLQIDVLDREEHTALVFSDAYRVDGEGNPAGEDTEFSRLKPYGGKIFRELFRDNFIHTSTAIVRKGCLDKVGLFDESGRLFLAEDYDLFLRIAARYEIDYISRPLIKYRVHTGNISGRNMVDEMPQIITALEKILLWDPRLANELGVIKNRRFSQLHYWLGRCLLSSSQFRESRRHFLRAVRYSPWSLRPYVHLFFAMAGTLAVRAVRKE